RVPVPLCAVDYQWFESRARIEKRFLMPIWTAAVLLNNVLIVTEVTSGGPGVSCCTAVGVLMSALLASALISRGRIGITGPPKKDVRLHGVHEAFAAALAEDRARDRVSNPAAAAGMAMCGTITTMRRANESCAAGHRGPVRVLVSSRLGTAVAWSNRQAALEHDGEV